METEIDTYLTEKIICPWCGAENDDDLTETDGKNTECCECGKSFWFERDYTIQYITRK